MIYTSAWSNTTNCLQMAFTHSDGSLSHFLFAEASFAQENLKLPWLFVCLKGIGLDDIFIDAVPVRLPLLDLALY